MLYLLWVYEEAQEVILVDWEIDEDFLPPNRYKVVKDDKDFLLTATFCSSGDRAKHVEKHYKEFLHVHANRLELIK